MIRAAWHRGQRFESQVRWNITSIRDGRKRRGDFRGLFLSQWQFRDGFNGCRQNPGIAAQQRMGQRVDPGSRKLMQPGITDCRQRQSARDVRRLVIDHQTRQKFRDRRRFRQMRKLRTKVVHFRRAKRRAVDAFAECLD